MKPFDPPRRTQGRPWRVVCATLILAQALAGCAFLNFRQAERHAQAGEWPLAVEKYQEAYKAAPGNVEYKSRLIQAKERDANEIARRADALIEERKAGEAVAVLHQGLRRHPRHPRLRQDLARALAMVEAEARYREGLALLQAGKDKQAEATLRRALDLDPAHPQVQQALKALEARRPSDTLEALKLPTKPVTLAFKNTDLRMAFQFLAKAGGINILLEEGVKGKPMTLSLKDVPFDQALRLLLITQRLFVKPLGTGALLVIPDTPAKRAQYEDQQVRVFYLTTLKAKEAASLVRTLLAMKKVVVNEALNALVVRDTPEKLTLVEKLLSANDRKEPECILEVEILEVNRSKLEQLGVDYAPWTIGMNLSQVDLGSPERFTRSLTYLLDTNALFTIPNATIRLFKSDVGAKTLANPRIRALNRKPAKIHIGDRVPLRVSTILDATGQVRTTFEYREIGIKLTMEPDIHLDRSVTIKMNLEVSSLGENLGTPEEPQYRIGTRNAESVLSLRDGETVVLGGLIREEERNTKAKIPFLGDIPILGRLFGSHEDSRGRTDILLTITPRVVRGLEVPGLSERRFWSGSEKTFATEPLFKPPSLPEEKAGEASSPSVPAPTSVKPSPKAEPTPEAAPPEAARPRQQPASLAFGASVHEVVPGGEVAVELRGSAWQGVAGGEVLVLFNPAVVALAAVEPGPWPAGAGVSVRPGEGAPQGTLRLILEGGGNTLSGEGVLAVLRFRGMATGTSHLVIQATGFKDAQGQPHALEARASRIVVKKP